MEVFETVAACFLGLMGAFSIVVAAKQKGEASFWWAMMGIILLMMGAAGTGMQVVMP